MGDEAFEKGLLESGMWYGLPNGQVVYDWQAAEHECWKMQVDHCNAARTFAVNDTSLS